MTPEQLAAAAAELGLPPRVEPECYLPDEAQIRLEKARIRFGWDRATRDARLGRM